MDFYTAMQEALRSPRYFYLRGGFDAILESIYDFLMRILERLFGALDVEFRGTGGGADIEVLRGVFLAIAAIIVVAIVVFCVRIYLKRKRKGNQYSDEIFEDFRKNRLSFDEIMALAKKHDQENNLIEAARYRYIGLIMIFSAKEIVNVSDSMTGGQFEREVVKNMPSAQVGVRNTINMYYSLFFGHKSVSPEAYEAHLRAYDAVIEEARNYGEN